MGIFPEITLFSSSSLSSFLTGAAAFAFLAFPERSLLRPKGDTQDLKLKGVTLLSILVVKSLVRVMFVCSSKEEEKSFFLFFFFF